MPVPSRELPLRRRGSTLLAALATVVTLATAACGARTFVVDGSCEEGLTACSGACVDLDDDRANCGECDVGCDGACVDGLCEDDDPCPPDGCPQCASWQIVCGGTCVDPASNGSHCGDCFQPCDGNQACVEGACVTSGCICDLCGTVDLAGDATGTVSGTTAGSSDQSTSQCSSTGAPDVTHAFRAPSAGSGPSTPTGRPSTRRSSPASTARKSTAATTWTAS